MPRIRTIKPDFFTSDTVSELPIRARLTWIGLWTHCDDHGRCRDNVRLIKAAVWPLDNVSLRDIEEDLDSLRNHGLIFSYEVDGKNYLQVTSWTEHQKVDRPSKSPIPPPPDGPSHKSREPLASVRESLDLEGKGRERKGANSRDLAIDPALEPPRNCKEHINVKNPPACGRCKEARHAHDDWLTAKTERVIGAEKCLIHRGQLAHNCSGCRADYLVGAA